MTREKPVFEFSAGGLVLDHGKILRVRVENLEGRKVWTFPKGHIERGERAQETALREVEEETGWRCRCGAALEKVRYFFKREDRLVKKTVTWFLMEPGTKTGKPDPREILETRWAALEEAEAISTYPSDRKLLRKLKKVSGTILNP